MLSEAERRTLENWAKRRKSAQGLARRARIVLACADGRSNTAVAARLRVNRGTVTKWRARFLARRLDGLGDEPRPGVPRTISDALVEEVVRTLEETPEGATHWSKRELAKRMGISPASVHQIWRAFGLQPWRTEDFKISPDPLLIGKIRDVIGLYLAPPGERSGLRGGREVPGAGLSGGQSGRPRRRLSEPCRGRRVVRGRIICCHYAAERDGCLRRVPGAAARPGGRGAVLDGAGRRSPAGRPG